MSSEEYSADSDSGFDQSSSYAVRRELIERLRNCYFSDYDGTLHFGETDFGRMASSALMDAWNAAPTPDREQYTEGMMECFADYIVAMRNYRTGTEASPNRWAIQDQPIHKVRIRQTPLSDRSSLELLAGRYLALPFRSGAFERSLVEKLIETEFYSYADEVMNAPHIPGINEPPILRQKGPILTWAMARGINLLVLLGVAAIAWVLSVLGVHEAIVIGLYAILFIVFLADMVWATINLPGYWLRTRAAKKRAISLIDAMAGVYAAMSSDGPISAAHIRERATQAANLGVVWPAPLFALLGDVERRSGRM